MERHLVSMIVLSYNNFKYIFECIDSIFEQDYSNIEIVVNGDGSDDFNDSELIEYFRQHRPENIKKIIINNNETNIGTVRSANKCVDMSNGKYYMLIAADDALFDRNVISSYVDFYETSVDREVFAIGNILMMDDCLHGELFTYPSEDDEEILFTYDSKQLFNVLVQRYFLPMNNILPRSYFDKYGGYDEEYMLIEDVPFYAKALCRGTTMHYLNIPVLKHRDGGISHGNKRNDSSAANIYIKDTITLFERDFLPNMELLVPKSKRALKSRYADLKALHLKQLHAEELLKTRFKHTLKHPYILLARPMAKRIYRKVTGYTSHKLGVMSFAGVLLLILYQFSDWASLIPVFGNAIHLLCGYCGLAAIAMGVALFVMKALLLRISKSG